jgi:flagellar FliL protein
MFGRKPKPSAPDKAKDPVEPDAPETDESEDESSDAKPVPAAPPASRGSLLKSGVGVLAITLIAVGGGVFLGRQTGAALERAIAERDARIAAAEDHSLTVKYSGDTVVKTVEPVITNLASPHDTWVRLETAMIFKNGALANPDVTAAQLRQDAVAYLRTLSLGQLEGPSALQHLREDLNERAALRSGGKVSELVIQTLIVQ